MSEEIVETKAPHLGVSHIVKSKAPQREILKDMSGTYRMIHGSIELPRPKSEWTFPDGSINPHADKTIRASVHVTKVDKGEPIAWAGDEVWLSHDDAVRMLAADMVETLDTNPSRCGKVCEPAKPGRVYVPAKSRAEREASVGGG